MGEEDMQEAGAKAGIVPVVGLVQEDWLWESWAGRSLAEGQVCSDEAAGEAEWQGNELCGLESVWGQGVLDCGG